MAEQHWRRPRKRELKEARQQRAASMAAHDRVLGIMSLDMNLLRRLPDPMRLQLRTWTVPAPSITVDPGSTFPELARRAAIQIAEKLLAARLRVCAQPLKLIGLVDFLTVAAGIETAYRALRERNDNVKDAGLIEPLALGAERAAQFYDAHFRTALNAMGSIARAAAFQHSRADERVMWFRLEPTINAAGKRVLPLKVVLGFVEPEMQHAQWKCGGGSDSASARRIYRCGAQVGPGPVRWFTWNAKDLAWRDADGNGDRVYPVYVQSHLPRRLKERLGELGWRAHAGFLESALHPVVTSGSGQDQFLIEYRLRGRRLGHLGVRRDGDRVVITTFLFLTMQGTPEAELLYQKLHLGRRDIEYQKLDQLATFLNTDLGSDPQLVELLTACGCGDLLQVGQLRAGCKRGYAVDLRKHLRLGEPRVDWHREDLGM